MKRTPARALIATALLCLLLCGQGWAATAAEGGEEEMLSIRMQAGGESFTVALYDTPSSRAVLALLPVTLGMNELNGNEKYYRFAERFPTDTEQVDTIRTGDLMLYGDDYLVLFYASFPPAYSYTRLGYVEDAEGLADALGSGGVEVTFSMDEEKEGE